MRFLKCIVCGVLAGAAMAAASAFAEEKKREDVDVSADPGKIGDAAGVVGELGGPSKKTLDAVDKVNEANKKDFENRKAVDDKMDLEAQQKYNDSLQGKNAAKRGYTQSVEKHTQAVRNEKNAGYNLHRKEVTQYKTNQKYNDSKLKYENALKRNDPNVHKYEFEMNKNKAALDKANTDVTEAKQRFEQSKVETSNAQKNVEVQKAKLDEATEKFNKAAKNKEIVNKSNTTKGKKPTQVSPKETTTQKITKTIGDVVTTTDFGSKVYDYREAVNSGDEEGQRNALFGLSESTLTALAASNPETAAVMAAYNTGKTVKQTVDQAADAERAKSEARDGIKGAQAVQIAADLMSASRDPKTGKPTMTVEEALHRADGYVFGYGDKDNTEFVESMYNDGKVKDKNGNPKPMPKEDELHKMSVVEIIKNSGEGIKDAFVGLGENAAKTFIAAKETGADLLDAGKSLLTEKGVAWETIKGTGNDIADNAHAVGTGLVNSDYWKDRAEAVDAALKGAWDGAKENYDALTGKKSTEQTMKDDQRAMEYKLVEMGMSQKDASRVANEFYNGNNSAAMQEIKEFKSGLSDSEKMQGDINRIQKEKEDILKQIQELGGKDPARQKELMDEYKRLTENQNNLKTTQQGLRELEEDEKKRAEKEAKEKAEKDAKVGEEKGKKNADENKEEKKDGDNEGKKAEDEQKTTEGEEGKKADEDNQKTEGDPKTTEGDPKATEGDPKTTEGDPKTTEGDPKTTETDPKSGEEGKDTEEGKNAGDNENRQTSGGERHRPRAKVPPKDPKEPQEPKNPEDENDNDNEKNDNDLRTSEGNTPTDPNGEGSQIPNGPAGPSLSGFLGKWLEEQGQKFLENNNLNQHTWQEYEQAYRNAIAQQNAKQTISQGGEAAQQISTESANATANAQQENSWGKHLSDAVQQSITAGLSSLGTSFANVAGESVANELLKGIEGKKGHGDSGSGGGDSGSDGGEGSSGASGGEGGGAGESGGAGASGESGESGEPGESGEGGAPGDTGESGEGSGHGDDNGESGASGDSGKSGSSDSSGGSGDSGASRKSRATGNSGSGSGGNSGGTKKSSNPGHCPRCGVELAYMRKQQLSFHGNNIETYCEACQVDIFDKQENGSATGSFECRICKKKVRYLYEDKCADCCSKYLRYDAKYEWSEGKGAGTATYTCSVCGRKVNHAISSDYDKDGQFICSNNCWRKKKGLSSSSDSGQVNGTYSSSSGPAKKSDTSAYKCDYCGKGMNSYVSGKGSGRYCSNACYQNAIKKK